MNVAVCGAGSIGVAWAIVFARAGHAVALYEPESARVAPALSELEARLAEVEDAGLLGEPGAAVRARVRVAPSLAGAVHDAGHVQECAPEAVEVKRELFAALDAAAPADAVLASSSSAIPISAVAAALAGRGRCLVVHPANPPHLLPIAELAPAPFTAEEVVARTRAMLAAAGMSPVVVHGEPEGFVYNRLQGAVLREAYCLVRDGVVSVDDLDRVVRDGLGRRWSVIGPFETADLNVRGGIAEHARRMGPAYARMGAERGQDDPWTPELVERVAAERRALLPLSEWEARVAWRDRALIAAEVARRAAAAADPARPEPRD